MFILVPLLIFQFFGRVVSWNDESVLLRDAQALTLYKNRYTTARRSSPVPQLKCVGGSAGCMAFIPDVVQCLNRGWDGVDVQWECKTDMDTSYRFGAVQVSCEGYNHPSDAYILKGSCGLEYTLELTEEGRRSQRGSSHHPGGSRSRGGLADFVSGFFGSSSGSRNEQTHHHAPAGERSGDLLVVAFLLLLAFGVYKLFLSGNSEQRGQDAGQFEYPQGHDNSFTAGPPPPGFKPDFTGAAGAGPGYGFHSGFTRGAGYRDGRSAPGTGGGFWSGMGTGGVLGYMFGRQRNQPYTTPPYTTPPTNTNQSSTGTRTASGFGGTKRR